MLGGAAALAVLRARVAPAKPPHSPPETPCGSLVGAPAALLTVALLLGGCGKSLGDFPTIRCARDGSCPSPLFCVDNLCVETPPGPSSSSTGTSSASGS